MYIVENFWFTLFEICITIGFGYTISTIIAKKIKKEIFLKIKNILKTSLKYSFILLLLIGQSLTVYNIMSFLFIGDVFMWYLIITTVLGNTIIMYHVLTR